MTLVAENTKAMTAPKDSDVVLSVQGVSKKFCRDFKSALFYGVQDISSEVLGLRGDHNDRLRKKEFWALQDVSFELRRGEALGLVGKNGSGKSTLLRIIAGLIKPDVGTVTVKGRVAPLIALGAGFNPVLTGRENIYANMSILGLSREEIDDRFDDVVAFAEIPEAIDSPVRGYSSGMQARLGFACAIHTEPEILLIDEVLAVGDVRFRGKCQRKLSDLRKKGIAFVLVSHQAPAILNVCDSAIFLSKGKLLLSGSSPEVMNKYEEDLFSEGKSSVYGPIVLKAKPVHESQGIDILSIAFKDSKSRIIEAPVTGEPTYLSIEVRATKSMQDVNVFVAISEIAGEGDLVLHLSNFYDDKKFDIETGKHEFQLLLEDLGLRPTSYTANILVKQGSFYTLDAYEGFKFKVTSLQKIHRGLFHQNRQWMIDNNK